jgi:hypothetical protein
MDINTRNDLLSKEFSTDQVTDINRAIEALPEYDLQIETFTEGFEDILVEDNVSIKITVIRNNLLPEQEIGIGHSLGFTELFEEKVSINLIANKLIFGNAVETIKERNTVHTFNFQPNEVGKIKVTCDMISLDYKGVNISKEFEINVLKTSEKRKVHLDDIEKRKVKKIEPSYFQQLLSSVVPMGNDEEEEEEEEEEDDKKEKKDKDNKDEEKKDEEKKGNDEGKNEEEEEDDEQHKKQD